MDSKKEYISRINKALDYIDNNLSKNFTLSEIAKVACFSKFHFHRIFYSIVGETLFNYIERIKLEKSAGFLLTKKNMTITDIAFQCGFSGSAVFSRAFKKFFSISPSEWRKKDCIQNNFFRKDLKLNAFQEEKLDYSKFIKHHKNIIIWDIKTEDKKYFVEVKEIPEITVAYIRNIGAYKGDAKLFERLYNKLFNWAIPRNLINDNTCYYNVYHDTPELTKDKKLRLSVCINIPENIEVHGEIGKMKINRGKYAFAEFYLGDNEYQEAWDWVFTKWLPESGFQPDDGLPFEMMDGEKNREGKTHVNIVIPVTPL